MYYIHRSRGLGGLINEWLLAMMRVHGRRERTRGLEFAVGVDDRDSFGDSVERPHSEDA